MRRRKDTFYEINLMPTVERTIHLYLGLLMGTGNETVLLRCTDELQEEYTVTKVSWKETPLLRCPGRWKERCTKLS
jgi:hypothetical protein